MEEVFEKQIVDNQVLVHFQSRMFYGVQPEVDTTRSFGRMCLENLSPI